MSLRMEADALHMLTGERAEKAPLRLPLMRQTSATPRFSQLSKQTSPP